jgi:hypothetical protein
MNPEDKFMNPRKPPPQPQSVRLQTSASVRRDPSPASSKSPMTRVHRSASQPYSATRKGHKKDSRSMSPPAARALVAALRQPTDADRKLETAHWANTPTRSPQRGESDEKHRNVPGIKVNAEIAVPSSAIFPNKPGPVGPSTIQSRRAMKAATGDAAPGCLLTVQTRPEPRKPSPSRSAANGKTGLDETGAIREALKGFASSSDLPTPTAAFTKEKKEKRLPTLPNTPSSVMDEAVRAIDERDKAMDGEIPRSHFSSMTVTTDDSTHSRFIPERSRFSEWSTDTDTEYNPCASMVSTSSFSNHYFDETSADDRWKTPDLSQSGDGATNTDPNTPHLTVHSKPSSPNSASGELPPWNVSLPEFTVSLSTPGIECSGLGIENMDEVESNPKRHAALFSALESMESFSMSRSPNGSPITLPHIPKDYGTPRKLSDTEREVSEASLERIRSRRSNAFFSENATMQEMMDELSYLRNMIQSEMDGTPF